MVDLFQSLKGRKERKAGTEVVGKGAILIYDSSIIEYYYLLF